jgi:hypothetical protein
MSGVIFRGLLGGLVVLLFGTAPSHSAEQPRSAGPLRSVQRRVVYPVKFGTAKDLAAVLTKHFKGEAEVQALAESPHNYLLINAEPRAFEEVLKVLEQIDRRPRQVAIEILIAEIATKRNEGQKPQPEVLKPRGLAGPAAEILEKLEALQQKGTLAGLKRITLAATENQRTSVQYAERKPYVTGIMMRSQPGVGGPPESGGERKPFAPGGKTSRGSVMSQSVQYQNLGTMVRVIPSITSEQLVRLNLEIEDSRAHVPEDGVVLGQDSNAAPVRAAEFINLSLNGTVSVTSGQARVVEGVKTTSKSGDKQGLIIVTASIVE